MLDPELIVIGGSITGASDLYRPVFESRLERHATRIADAELGLAAGVIGAAALNMDGDESHAGGQAGAAQRSTKR